jgi:hypothetical protein
MKLWFRFPKRARRTPPARLHFRVEDTGIGISPQAQARLFEAFSQGDGSSTRECSGTGPGLAIAKQLARHMHGEIEVTSEPGKGSTFWFTVELEKTSDRESRRSTFPSEFGWGERTVGRRHATNRRILRHQLETRRMRVDTASIGEEALKMLQSAVGAGRYRSRMPLSALQAWRLIDNWRDPASLV